MVFNLMHKIALVINELNKTFYFLIDINTKIPWSFFILIPSLYFVLKIYIEDKKLDTTELLKFLVFYGIVLFLIVSSYSGPDVLKNASNQKGSFFIIAGMAVGIIIILAIFAGDNTGQNVDDRRKMNWILIISYVPIFLLIITNGRILNEKIGVLKNLLPRSESRIFQAANLKGEIDELRVGGVVNPAEIEDILKESKYVDQAYVIGMQDDTKNDNLIKPYAIVVLKSESKDKQSDKLRDNLKKLVIMKKSAYLVPFDIEFLDGKSLPKGSPKTTRAALQRQRKNWSDLFGTP